MVILAMHRRLCRTIMPLGVVFSAPVLIWGGGDVSFLSSLDTKPHSSSWNYKDVTERLRVACIGDSITFGDGSQPCSGVDPNPVSGIHYSDRGSYPLKLQHLLESARPGVFQVGMFAVGGTTARCSDHLDTARHKCRKDLNNATGCALRDTFAFASALRFAPHIVLLMLGTNDAKDEAPVLHRFLDADTRALMRNITAAIPHGYRDNNSWLMLPPRVYQNPHGIFPDMLERHVWPILKHAASQERWKLIDLGTVLDHDRPRHFGRPFQGDEHGHGWFPMKSLVRLISDSSVSPGDGVHPKAAGSHKIAEIVAPYILARYDSGALRVRATRTAQVTARRETRKE